MIALKNVSKWYQDFQALKNCSVAVEKGEVLEPDSKVHGVLQSLAMRRVSMRMLAM